MDKTITYLKSILDSKSIVVIGCSGGPDSMCLFHILCDLKNEIGYKLIVAHMNHKQRSESEEEANFVKTSSLNNGCEYEYYELKANFTSNFHSEARHIRYQFFNNVIEKYHANYLMTAHHGDDLMETILMRLSRGSTLKGYSGFDTMSYKDNYKQIHPLIFYTKDEIKKYMDCHKYKYYIDRTNESDDYTRNRYRHHILPFLKKENPLILERYYKFSETINEADKYIASIVKKWLSTNYLNNILDLVAFKKADEYLQKRIIEYLLDKYYPDNLYLITDNNTRTIINAIYNKKPNIIIELPNSIVAIKDYNKLYLSKKEDYIPHKTIFNKQYFDDYNIIEDIPSSDIVKSNYLIRLNSNEITLPLIIRNRLDGDYMFIKNNNGKTKLKDIFINEKINKKDRDQFLILTDSSNNILWLPGLKKSKFDKDISEKYDIILRYIKKER